MNSATSLPFEICGTLRSCLL